jgi:ankyrin repeat protein
LAVSTNLEEIALILLLTGSDPNITDYDDKTPLHEAAYNGYGKMVKMLVDNKADVTLKDGKGQTAQDMAEKTKEEDIAKFLKVNWKCFVYRPTM